MERLLIRLQNAAVRWECNVPLSKHSSFRIGGGADLALFPTSRAQLIDGLSILRESGLPTTVIGRGSNVVFSDEGYRGAIVFTSGCRGLSVTDRTMDAECGVTLSAVANAAREAGLTGAEFAYGIPGTVGGAVFMNAGAFNGCMADICVRSEYFDMESGGVHLLEGDEQKFGTRESVYQRYPTRIILGARLSLSYGIADDIHAKMQDFLERRRSTQPLELPNAGSIFKRPVGYYAGKLIEDCGLKGRRIGGAEVSEKHAGFIVNRGGATAEDVKRLVELVRETVLRETGVELECEVRFL
jgi:UDP-N-acetylmuramate dehydrogenase